MNRSDPAPVPRLLGRKADISQEVPVYEICPTVGVSGPDDGRDRADNQLEFKFPPLQLFVGLGEFPGSRFDALIEFAGKVHLLPQPQPPSRLQANHSSVGRDAD